MAEKQWRVRFFGKTHTVDHVLPSLRTAVNRGRALHLETDTRKPFVYYSDHARGPIDCLSCGAGDPADESCCNGDPIADAAASQVLGKLQGLVLK